MKKYFYSISLVGFAIIAGLFAYDKQQEQSISDLTLTNVEALAQTGEGLDCRYNRHEGQCTVNVGAKGQIKIFTGTILDADANGNITFDGKVTCSGGGSFTCTPIECIELYSTIF